MKIAVFTGAGISAESGIETYRDHDNGMWYNYHTDEVASVKGWEKTPEKVLEFHNLMRNKCREAQPNEAHKALARLEEKHDVTIITQNVDDLHERGGSTKLLHLHGEILKGRDSFDKILDIEGDLDIGDLDEFDEQIRPHTVLFGEEPFNWFESLNAINDATVFIIIGTSFSIGYSIHILAACEYGTKVYYIDPKPDLGIHHVNSDDVELIYAKATKGVTELVDKLLG
tara:strand:- start:11859 stop:12542 length:684 start_codon:yes stop_codon:yes gene_type:complete